MDYVLIPHILHIPPHIFTQYPMALQERMRAGVLQLMAFRFAGSPPEVRDASYG